MTAHPYAFPKSRRLCGKHLAERLFEPGAAKSASSFPLRLVYRLEVGGGETKMMVSVPKRHFKRAVDRNLAKRRVREAYRVNRDAVTLPEDTRALIAVLWTDGRHRPSAVVAEKLRGLLRRMSEEIMSRRPDAPEPRQDAQDR